MMHPSFRDMVSTLTDQWDKALKDAQTQMYLKMTKRAPQYEQVSPVWMRFNTREQFITMIMLKAERVRSELYSTPLDEWDPDNAIDLIIYTLFLIAYSAFIRGEHDDQSKSET